jgi:hypothetical protein
MKKTNTLSDVISAFFQLWDNKITSAVKIQTAAIANYKVILSSVPEAEILTPTVLYNGPSTLIISNWPCSKRPLQSKRNGMYRKQLWRLRLILADVEAGEMQPSIVWNCKLCIPFKNTLSRSALMLFRLWDNTVTLLVFCVVTIVYEYDFRLVITKQICLVLW